MPTLPAPTPRRPLTTGEIAATWAPLAGSWLLMGLELPAVSAAMARLPNATVSLAAYGGLVFPMALLMESPIIMLLSASTALARDQASYAVVRRYMMVTATVLTAVHALIAFTPLFDVLANQVIAVPPPVREPARLGLRIMLPWIFSIAYRRTQQGVLIRFGQARAVTLGTIVRLATNATLLTIGLLTRRFPGIVVGCSAITSGVVAEAIFAGLVVRPVIRSEIRGVVAGGEPLTMRAFLAFYVPLIFTPLINFLALPLSAAAMSRMPAALASLAVWPVLSGVTFTLRSAGFAFNEVVVAKLEAFRPLPALRRFTIALSIAASAALLVMAATPLSAWWFGRVSALPPALAVMGRAAFWIMVPAPAISVWQSWHQGALVHSRRTRGVTESVIVLLAATALVLAGGVAWRTTGGLNVAAMALVVGGLAQIGWLARRTRSEFALVAARDAGGAAGA